MGSIEKPDSDVLPSECSHQLTRYCAIQSGETANLACLEEKSRSGPEEHLDTEALECLETHEQRRVLDIVSQLRKCGLDSVLSLPQLVVCGDQSAGKSSVLEALTGVPFPRKDNLCTRYPTEIILRRGVSNSLRIKVIPDPLRSVDDQKAIKEFRETITSFEQLPSVMEKARELMGIENSREGNNNRKAFARDVLSVEIEGPDRPQLTVVDLPGIIQAKTKDASQADVDMTVEITESYISQPRTICLAVVSATNDYANQPILNKVRQFDPKGERTLGIITKPDRLPPGSDTEAAFLQLAKNEDIFFTLGWHVLKNRSFEEAQSSIQERNLSESRFFRKSVFGSLSPENVGIGSLISRLSRLLFTHVQQELPRLQEDLGVALHDAKRELGVMGTARATPEECRIFLSQLALSFYEVCKAAVNGHYEGDYFRPDTKSLSNPHSTPIRRLRAAVQLMNQKFAEEMRARGHKFQIQGMGQSASSVNVAKQVTDLDNEKEPPKGAKEQRPADTSNTHAYQVFLHIRQSQWISHQNAVNWVKGVVTRARGRELLGNFNPLVIAELFWEQSSKWNLFAEAHINQVSDVCSRFLQIALKDKAPLDMYARIWPRILERIKERHRNAMDELEKISKDNKSYVINYNHYYTETIKKRRSERQKARLGECLKKATQETKVADFAFSSMDGDRTFASIDVDHVLKLYSDHSDSDMDNYSSIEVLDCLLAIYKVGTLLLALGFSLPKFLIAGLPKNIYCKCYNSGS